MTKSAKGAVVLPNWKRQVPVRGATHYDCEFFEAPRFHVWSLDSVVKKLRQTDAEILRLVRGGATDDQILLQHLIDHIHLTDSILWKTRILDRLSFGLFEIAKALTLATQSKGHPLFDKRAAGKPHGDDRRAQIEAHAAVVLQLARTHEERQTRWLGEIAKVFKEHGYRRPKTAHRTAGPYSPDAIRKWHQACLDGRHQCANLFFDFVRWTWGPEEALADLRACLSSRWY